MARPYFYAIFLAIGFQLWVLGSLAWMLYWRRRVQARGITGWRAAPVALAPFIVLGFLCLAGLVRMVIGYVSG